MSHKALQGDEQPTHDRAVDEGADGPGAILLELSHSPPPPLLQNLGSSSKKRQCVHSRITGRGPADFVHLYSRNSTRRSDLVSSFGRPSNSTTILNPLIQMTRLRLK